MGDKPWGKEMGANQGGTDEWYTPVEAVMPLLPFLKKGSRILCPFDTDESQYVKCLSKDHSVAYSHISQGKDFFLLDKPDVDYIISNPPYSTRTEVLKQLYKWDIPFALILNSNGLFDSVTRSLLARGGVELLFLYPRVKYIDTQGTRSAPPYQSVYWCHNILPKQIMFADIEDPCGQQMDINDFLGDKQ